MTNQPTVAVLGASQDRAKFGDKSVRAHQQAGYEVYPVNPKGGEIEGLTVSATIEEVPVTGLDRVSMYLPPAIGINVLEAIAAKGCNELWLNPGTSSAELVSQAKELGLNVVEACSIVELGVDPASL